jgi:hypothetical protein
MENAHDRACDPHLVALLVIAMVNSIARESRLIPRIGEVGAPVTTCSITRGVGYWKTTTLFVAASGYLS